MKPVWIVELPTVKSLMTTLVIVTLTSQQLAFAASAASAAGGPLSAAAVNAHTPSPALSIANVRSALPLAKTAKQGIVVIELAESRPFSTYFENGGTPQEIDRLDHDMKNLAVANALVGIANDLKVFEPWWEAHKTSLLLSRDKLRGSNLQDVFTQVFIIFKADETKAQKDPNQFLSWLSGRVTDPVVRYASFTAFAVMIGTLSYTVGLIKGAMVAGPAASVIGALVEPFVRPIREKASIVGSRLFGNWGVKLSAKLFKDQGNSDGAMADLTRMSSDIQAAREGAKEAHLLMNTMGYDMSPSQFAANMSKIHSIWNKTNQVWVQTNPSLFKDGRDVFSNAIALRPQSYSGQIMQSLQGAEQARQAIEQHIDRIISRTGQNAQLVEESVVSLLRAVEINENAGQANKESAKEGLQKSKDALKALGASDYQVDRIIESRLAELVNVRHTAYTLAANVIHELQYEEYNRALPDEVQKIQRSLRDGTCLDYFHNEFKEQVAKILNEMDIRLTVAERTVDAAKASPDLKVVKGSSPVRKGKAGAVAARYIRSRVNRATDALGRMNSMRNNRAVIEQAGELSEEHAKDAAARAADVVKRVGKR